MQEYQSICSLQCNLADRPGTNLGEVHKHFVRVHGQVFFRLLDVVQLGLGVATTTDLGKRATRR